MHASAQRGHCHKRTRTLTEAQLRLPYQWRPTRGCYMYSIRSGGISETKMCAQEVLQMQDVK
jgi:hypothetical protein